MKKINGDKDLAKACPARAQRVQAAGPVSRRRACNDLGRRRPQRCRLEHSPANGFWQAFLPTPLDRLRSVRLARSDGPNFGISAIVADRCPALRARPPLSST